MRRVILTRRMAFLAVYPNGGGGYPTWRQLAGRALAYIRSDVDKPLSVGQVTAGHH